MAENWYQLCFTAIWFCGSDSCPGACLCGTLGSCMHIRLLLTTVTVPGHVIYQLIHMLDTCMPATVTLCYWQVMVCQASNFPNLAHQSWARSKMRDKLLPGWDYGTAGQRDHLRDCPTRCRTVARSVERGPDLETWNCYMSLKCHDKPAFEL